MPKIRGVKPDTWTDDDFVECTPLARLLFIGLWNFSCDNGHMDDKPRQIKMRVLPADDCDVSKLLDELVAKGLIERRDGYVKATKLPHHQNIDLRYLTLCEHCERDPEARFSGDDRLSRTKGTRRANDGRTTGTQRSHGGRPLGAHVDGEGEGDGEGELFRESAGADRAGASIDRFAEFWDAYDKKTGKKAAEQKWRLALKKPGVDADLLIQAARSYVASVKAAGKHPKFTKDPSTWLNGEHWDDEVPSDADEPDPYAHYLTPDQLRERRESS